MIPCNQCEYSERCFAPLKGIVHFGYTCTQGRKKKEFRVRQATLDETAKKLPEDTEVELSTV